MPVTQSIPNQRLTGQQTFNFTNTAQPWTNATLSIDRTVSGGLNSLTPADTLTVAIDYSPDGGTNWKNIGGSTLQGGTVTTKGVVTATDTLSVGIGQQFAVGTAFRVNTDASTPVRVTGTVVYS